jgi:hypothetical protein
MPEVVAFVIVTLIILGVALVMAVILYSRSRRSSQATFRVVTDLIDTDDRYEPRRESIVHRPHSPPMQIKILEIPETP